MMVRSLLMSTIVVAAALEPTISDLDMPLSRYALTQGGLLAVVLVLLWTMRKDYQRVLTDRADQLEIMTDLVKASTMALTRSADATDRMARAVENLERTR